ncbi:odorant receptor 46a-like [Aphidius gifuensis]|uniref:odorant receptor 46a-like n=1 Tax=Aphidius gifuensis TaxID=684658 RepID=UPI001CDD724D|nr:odorant receptor 46a-like [Aphidius gifuensis]
MSMINNDRLKPRDIYESNIIDKTTRSINFIALTNDTFTFTIFIQYFASALVLCVSTFKLLNAKPFSSEFFSMVIYTTTMLIQIYIYCNNASKVTYQSETLTLSIYDSEWTSLSINERKSLIIIMASTLAPQVYKSGYMITLSLRAFTNILKTSYSIFSILK